MIDVVLNIVRTVDHFVHARTGPQVGREPVGLGSFEQLTPQAIALPFRQLVGTTRLRLGSQSRLAFPLIRASPSADAAGIDAQTLGDLARRSTRLQQLDRLRAPLLQCLR